MEKSNSPQFYCEEGTIAFIIPFTFEPIKSAEQDICTYLFQKIENECCERDGKDKQLLQIFQDNEDLLKPIYQKCKDELVNILQGEFDKEHPETYKLFKHEGCSSDQWPKKCGYNCKMQEYEGRNLCKCFAVSRKFHDDASQDTPRLEVYLGSYPVLYKKGESNIICFSIDAMLLLTKEREQNGTSAGYVLFNIHLNLGKTEDCYYQGTDKFIFVKHLFYKNRLKCIINNDEKEISLQKWTEQYLQSLFSILKIDYHKAINDYVSKEGAFKYSLIELNLRDSETSKITLHDIQENYTQQIYGLLVGDEGWRYFPKSEVKYSHWSSREHSYSFFLDHNALIINVDNENYHSSAKEWFKNYSDSYNTYYSYPDLRPCFPGVSSLTFDAFIKTVYKEMIIEKAKETAPTDINASAEELFLLGRTLQMYSMSLDEIRKLEDIISNSFGIKNNIQTVRELYNQTAQNIVNNANQTQSTKITFLTNISALIALLSLAIALVSTIMSVVQYKIEDKMENVLVGPYFGTAVLSFVVLVVAILAFVLIYKKTK